MTTPAELVRALLQAAPELAPKGSTAFYVAELAARIQVAESGIQRESVKLPLRRAKATRMRDQAFRDYEADMVAAAERLARAQRAADEVESTDNLRVLEERSAALSRAIAALQEFAGAAEHVDWADVVERALQEDPGIAVPPRWPRPAAVQP